MPSRPIPMPKRVTVYSAGKMTGDGVIKRLFVAESQRRMTAITVDRVRSAFSGVPGEAGGS